MPVNEFHRRVAAIVLPVAAEHGFVIAGGNALIWHGIVERYTADLDLFSPSPTAVEDAAAAVEEALRDAGLGVERQDKAAGLGDIWYGLGEGLGEWVITGPGGEQMVLQMAHFARSRDPVTVNALPILDVEDAVGWKVHALVTRVEPRDYVDVAAALERYTVPQLIAFARRLEPSLQPDEFADAGARLDQMSDARFARMQAGPEAIARIRERFAAWPRDPAQVPGPPGQENP